jgi:hypothetical protein
MDYSTMTYDALKKEHKKLKDELKKISKYINKNRTTEFMKATRIKCDYCNIETNKYNFKLHLLSDQHKRNTEPQPTIKSDERTI